MHTVNNDDFFEQAQQAEPWEKFCDSNCVWTDHHPDCKLAQQAEPVIDKSAAIRIATALGWKPPRQPLTDEEIWKFWWARPEVPDGEDDSMEAEFVAAVRRVLAAHHITKEST